MTKTLLSIVVWIAAAAFSRAAFAQATVKDDGKWRAALGLAASATSGNTKSSSFALTGDLARATATDKWSWYGNALYGKSAGLTTSEQLRAGTRYDYNLTSQWFGFGLLDLEKDQVAALNLRSGLGAGSGYHVIKDAQTTFDVFGGVGYTSDKYDLPRLIDGANRSNYSYTTLLFGEESTHKISDSVSAKQKLVVYPNMKNSGEYRAQFDAGLGVAMSKTMNLNVGFSSRINSDPGPGFKKTDTLLTTGISVKFE